MSVPRFCPNQSCNNHLSAARGWLIRNGTYLTIAHGRVQRYLCKGCRCGLSDQSESIHYYAKRKLNLKEVFSRLRAGSSMRDIGRELGCSRTAISNAVVRLGRQSMAAHLSSIARFVSTSHLCFDGLVSSVTGNDYPAQITTLGDSSTELVLAMSHCVTQRTGVRTGVQARRIGQRRSVWKPSRGALSQSICLLVNELSRFTEAKKLLIDTDEHPIYRSVLHQDLALSWLRSHRLLELRTTPGSAPRTLSNPLFLMNYVDRMIRHRLIEHTRASIARARNTTMQMHRMWIFAWDHNACQPRRVAAPGDHSRAIHAGIPQKTINRTKRSFFSRRVSLRGLPVPETIRSVWCAELETPPVRWKVRQKSSGPLIPRYAIRDLACAYPQGP